MTMNRDELEELRVKLAVKNVNFVLITGASRSGKTRLTDWIEAHSTRVSVFRQDDYYVGLHSAASVPKVRLQDAPFVRVGTWDVHDSVDWTTLEINVCHCVEQLVPAQTPHTIIVEGNMLVGVDWLVRCAHMIVCLEIDKWTCFDRRAASAKRQCHWPYLVHMWEEHCKRFKEFLKDAGARSNTHFLTPEAFEALLQTRPTLPVSPGSVDDNAVAALERILACAHPLSARVLAALNDDSRCPPDQPVIGPNAALAAYLADRPADSLAGRLLAMYLGVALGDASGAPFEFHHQKPFEWSGRLDVPLVMTGRGGVRGAPPGAITDDFQMTLASLRTLHANDCQYSKQSHIRAYIQFASELPGGIGSNTRALFQHTRTLNPARPMAKYRAAFEEAHADQTNLSRSNGTLMRASALIMIPDRARAIAAATEDARLSNDNHTNVYANRVYVALLHDLVRGGRRLPFDGWLNHDYLVALLPDACQCDDCIDVALVVMHAATKSDVSVSPGEGNMYEWINNKDKKGYVLVALWVALRLAQQLTRDEALDDALVSVVSLGGDTDTNAAITGALLGAHWGITKLYEEQKENIDVLLNVVYRYATVKNVLGLTPASLFTLLPAMVKAEEERASGNGDDDDDDASVTSIGAVQSTSEPSAKRRKPQSATANE